MSSCCGPARYEKKTSLVRVDLGPLAKALAVILLAFLLAVTVVTNVRAVSPYAPQKGDYFGYSETIAVNNGQGSYTGYTDQTKVTGMEQMDAMNGTTVSASYNYNFQFSNNQGSSTSSSSSGHYTWSSGTYTYLNGTDNQVGYSQPTYVWFVIDPSLPVGGTFYLLNTQFAILSKNYSLQVPNESGGYVLTIQGKGTGERQRNDDYGVFNVTYSWYAYFDPSTGYIVGYNYVEEDNGQYQGQAAGFTYTDDLYVTSTSYTLTPATSPATISTTGNVANLNAFEGLSPYLPLAFLFIIIVLIYAVTRGRGKRDSLPKHSPYPSPPTPSPAPLKPSIDLGSKPPEQVVIREVAKVNCRYCGTLIPTTVDTCPYCGGSRR